MLTFKNFNIADWFSFYRIAAAPFLIALLVLNERNLFTWFLLISYCTDAIDGFIARKLQITSPRGSQLDSMGDQITFTLGLVGILIFEIDFIKDNYGLIIVSFSPYILQMIIAFIKYGKATAFHTYLAKLSAIIQSAFILYLLFFEPIYWLFYVMIVVGILETIEEITLIFMYDNWVSGIKGYFWAIKDKRRNKKNIKCMRSYPLYIIILLCLFILVVDVIAFYWLLSILKLISFTFFKTLIYIFFWLFTIGLIGAIIFLKTNLNVFNPHRKQLIISWLYGLVILSLIPKFIFIVFITIINYTNIYFSDEVSLIVVALLGLFAGFLPFFIIIYSVFRALYRFKTHKIIVKFKELEKDLEGLKLVQISDLHLGSFNFRYHILDRAILRINELKPDFIFLTGDLVNNYAWELKGWSTVFQQLKATKGKFAVLGNHDYGDYSTWKSEKAKLTNQEIIHYFFKKIDFNLLLNETELVKVNNTTIGIVGVENWGLPPFKQYGNLQKALTNVPNELFKILLSHDPSHWSKEVLKETDIELTLSGHTHGMQAGINIKSKKWSPIKYKYKYWAGLYKINHQYLYVNRGLGWLGFPGRLGMRPEITCITLKKA